MTMSLSSPSTVWIQRPKPNPEARLRLFCFPYAGGGASAYRSWAAPLPDEIEVCAIQLPGRENRLREPLFTRLAPLVETLAGALEPSFDIPFAFFGHSMGALIAFELARFIRRRSQITPVHFFASARLAPHVVDSASPAHRLPEATFVAQIRGLQGTSAAVLDDPEEVSHATD